MSFQKQGYQISSAISQLPHCLFTAMWIVTLNHHSFYLFSISTHSIICSHTLCHLPTVASSMNSIICPHLCILDHNRCILNCHTICPSLSGRIYVSLTNAPQHGIQKQECTSPCHWQSTQCPPPVAVIAGQQMQRTHCSNQTTCHRSYWDH